MTAKLKRVYDTPASGDGCRILVDRIWPRGVSKQAASISLWLKTLAPSTALRKWYGHRPERWQEFRRRYFDELKYKDSELQIIRNELKEKRKVTMVYSARDTAHNQAVVLLEYLKKNDPEL
jgi:uncharacterized protein YeaO (DUF488 family)